MNKLQFYSLMFMPYPFIPPAEDLPSTWVNLPNTLYDPKVGHRLYNEYLELNVLTEKLGYDGVLVNEHHQTAYGTPSRSTATPCASPRRSRCSTSSRAAG